MPDSYSYLILCALYFVVWCFFFLLRKDLRKELCIITLFCAPLGITELFYYDYWRPDFLFPLSIRFGFEDLLWAGIVSGIGAVSYELLAKRRTYRVRKLSPGWMGEVWLSATLVLGLLILYFGTTHFGINSYTISIVGFLSVAAITVLWRQDLLRDALLSGLILATITLCVYQVWLLLYPHAFADYWVSKNISRFVILRVPVQELLYSFAWGSVIGPLFEVMGGLRLRKLKRER